MHSYIYIHLNTYNTLWSKNKKSKTKN